jgi:hypothetical protein
VILRVLNFIVIAMLVLSAAYVYRIKFEATVQAERLAKLRDEVRHERDKIASLRAKWGELDDPARIQALAERFLKLQPIAPTQFDNLDNLPPMPPDYLRPGYKDPIGGMIQHFVETPIVTGSATGSVTARAKSAGLPADSSSAAPAPAPRANPPATTPVAAAPANSGEAAR